MQKTKICPQCGFEGSVIKYFGTRNVVTQRDGVKAIPQAWCLDCRNAPKQKANNKVEDRLPDSRVALMRLYKQKTGDKKIRSSHYMRQALA